MSICRSIVLLLYIFCLGACATETYRGERHAGFPTLTGTTGNCSSVESTGVVGKYKQLERYDYDLDRDGKREIVIVDRSLCTKEGNCYWNLFSTTLKEHCNSYLGTVAGASLELLSTKGEKNFLDIRAQWILSDDSRLMVEEYKFIDTGYRMTGTLLCHLVSSNTVSCTEGNYYQPQVDIELDNEKNESRKSQ